MFCFVVALGWYVRARLRVARGPAASTRFERRRRRRYCGVTRLDERIAPAGTSRGPRARASLNAAARRLSGRR